MAVLRKHFFLIHTAEGNRYDLPLVIDLEAFSGAPALLGQMNGLGRDFTRDDTLRWDMFWLSYIRKSADPDEPILFSSNDSSILNAGYDTIQFRFEFSVRAPAANITIRDVVYELNNNFRTLVSGEYEGLFTIDIPDFTDPRLEEHMLFTTDSSAQDTQVHFMGISELSPFEEFSNSAGGISELGFSAEEYVFGKQSPNPLCADDEVQPIICPECVPNPAYQEPDFANHTGVYYNEKTCEYCIITDPPRPYETDDLTSPLLGVDLQLINDEYGGDVEQFVKNAKVFTTDENLDIDTVLRYCVKLIGKEYNKSQSNEYYNPNSVVADMPLEPNTRIDSSYNTNLAATEALVRIKVCVPKKYIDNIPEDDSPKGDYEEGEEELIIDADKWYGTMLRLRGGLRVYKKFYDLHLGREGDVSYLTKVDDPNKIPLLPKDIKQLIDDVVDLRKEIRKKASSNGYYLNVFATAPPFASKKVDKIKIKFNTEGEFYIKKIFVKSFGACDYERVYEQGDNSGPILNKNSIKGRSINHHALLSNLEAINDTLLSEDIPPWHKFFTTYLNPQVTLEYNGQSGLLDSQNQGNALACAMDKFPSIQDLLTASIGSLEEIFELLAFEYNKILCSEDTEKAKKDFKKRYPDENWPTGNDKVWNQAIKGNDDSLFLKLIDGDTYNTNGDLLAALTFCELDTLFGKILECLMGGIPFDKALGIIIKSLVSSLSINHLGKLFAFLPISTQQKIQQDVQTALNAPAPEPWSNTSALTPSEDKSVAQSTTMSLKDFDFQATQQGQENLTNQQIKQSGEEGKLSKVTGVIVQAYIDALFENIGFDELIGYLDKLPISPLIRGLLATFFQAYCPTTPLTDLLDIGQLIPKFKIDICDSNVSIHFPVIPDFKLVGWRKKALERLKDMIVRITISVFVKLIINLIQQIIALLDDLLCSLLGAIGSAAFGGNLGDLISSYLCDDEKSDDIIPELLNNIGITPEGFDPNIDTKELFGCFERAISRTMSQREIISAVVGKPLPAKTYEMVSKSIASSCPDIGQYFSDPKTVENFLNKVGDFMTPEAKNQALLYSDSLIMDDPACDVVCMSQEQLAIWDGLRINNLKSTGATEQEAKQIIDDVNQKALDDFQDLLDKANNLQDIISDAIAKEYGVSPIDPQPFGSEDDPSGLRSEDNAASNCKPYNPITDLPPELEATMGSIADFALKQIETVFYAETTGKKNSALSTILSNKDGLPYNRAARKKEPNFPETVADDYKAGLSNEELYENNYFGLTSAFEGDYYYSNRIRNWEKDDSFYFHQALDKKQTNLIIESIEIENDYKGDLLESNLLARSDKSYSEDAFYHILKTKSNNSFLSFIHGYKQTANRLFKIIQDILIVNNVDGFLHGGSDPVSLSDLTFDYMSPNGGEYNHQEEEKVLGIPKDNEKSKITFLDPKVHGGTYTKPKIYLIPEEDKGWLKIYKTFVEIDDPCKERINGPAPFRELKEYYDDLVSKIPFDKRLYQDEECLVEPPFNRAATPQIKALLDTLTRIKIQVYMIRLLTPGFVFLQKIRFKNNYDDAIVKILFEEMKMEFFGLYPKRTKNRRFIRAHRYWYIFLEQVVEAYIRQVQLGIIEPSQKELDALEEIKNVRKFYRMPTKEGIAKTREWIEDNPEVKPSKVFNYKMKSSDHKNFQEFYAYSTVFDDLVNDEYDSEEDYTIDKPRKARFKRFKIQLKCYAISRVEDACEVLFGSVFKQEMERFEEKMSAVLKPEVNSIHEYLFNGSFFQGSTLDIGTYSSMVNYSSGGYPAGKIEEIDLDQSLTIDNTKPTFVVQKYVRVVENKLTADTIRVDVRDQILLRQGTRNKEVTTLEEFKNIFTDYNADKSEKLSYYFGKNNKPPAYFGIRILYYHENSSVTVPVDNLEKAHNYNGQLLIPLVSYELPFEDETIDQFLSSESVNYYDDYCLVRNLIKEQDYLLLFDKIFPTRGYTSGYLINSLNSFVESIAFENQQNPEEIPELEEMEYKKTKRALRRVFVATYNDQDFEDEQEDNEEDKRSLLEFLKNLIPKFSLGLSDLFGRRIVKELDDCDDPLRALLKKDGE